jgi:DNA-binding phage protein
MPRPESTDTATARDRRSGPSPGSEARAVPPKRPITDPLFLAIDERQERGESMRSLARESGVNEASLYKFNSNISDMWLASIDKLIVALPLKVVLQGRDGPPPQSLSDAIRSVIDNDIRKIRELAKAAGINYTTLLKFKRGDCDMKLATAEKIAIIRGIKLVRATKASLARRDSATIEDKSIDQAATITQDEPQALVDRPRPPVPWSGTREQLEREIEAIESEACRDVVRALIELRPLKATRTVLDDKSKHGDSFNLLSDLRDSGSRLGNALGFPGRGRKGRWIEIEIID